MILLSLSLSVKTAFCGRDYELQGRTHNTHTKSNWGLGGGDLPSRVDKEKDEMIKKRKKKADN